MGRKKKEDWNRKNKVVTIRLSDLEVYDLEELSEREGCSKSEYIRKILEIEAKKAHPSRL